MPNVVKDRLAEALVDEVLLTPTHEGFDARNHDLVDQTRSVVLGDIAALGSEFTDQDDNSRREQVRGVISQRKAELNLLEVVGAVDSYLYLRDWQYGGERREEHQEVALMDILASLSSGISQGHAELATSTGKTYLIAKLTEACKMADKRVLILAPTKHIAYQIAGDENGLKRFAPYVQDEDVGLQFDGRQASTGSRVVVSTYQSLNSVIASGALGEFDLVLADEAHRALGETTRKNLVAISPHAVKIGFTATPDYGVDRSVSQILPECMHSLDMREAIERDLVAPIECLMFATGSEIRIKDPNRREFTERELSRLINLKSRNDKAIQMAVNFVGDGRQGIISCVPGADLAHPKLLAEELSKRTVTDKETGEVRPVVAKAIGGTIQETKQILEDFAEGRVDVLTFVSAIGEGWDSQVASFLINVCPTTSLVKITQLIGRVIRKKEPRTISTIVDFVDKAASKPRQTALHALGEEEVVLGKVYESSRYSTPQEARLTYLNRILDPTVYARLQAIDGILISSLTIGAKPENRRRTALYYERILSREGLGADGHMMGVPNSFIEGVNDYRNQFLVEEHRLPTVREIERFLSEHPMGGIRKWEIVRKALAAEKVELAGLARDLPDQFEQDTLVNPPEKAETEDLTDNIERVIYLSAPTGRDAEITLRYFGFNATSSSTSSAQQGPYLLETEPTLEQVGVEFNITRERVRQILYRTMSFIRHPAVSHVRTYYFEPSDKELDEQVQRAAKKRATYAKKKADDALTVALRRAVNEGEDKAQEPQPLPTGLIKLRDLEAYPVDFRRTYLANLRNAVNKLRAIDHEDGIRLHDLVTSTGARIVRSELGEHLFNELNKRKVRSLNDYRGYLRRLATLVEERMDEIRSDLASFRTGGVLSPRQRFYSYWMREFLKELFDEQEQPSA